ncbi:MAG: hypothetical protein HY231_23590 [Acidobacteria bacterium]|nr:hypothetical protein [Acidobacteriota bacterium]
MKRICKSLLLISIVNVLGFSLNAFAAQDEREFTGTINNTIHIRMKLTQSGKVIGGTYLYEKIGKDIHLNGTINGQQVTLKESDNSGTTTGVFKGRFVTADTLEGTWSNADGSKTFPFRVSAAAAANAPATSAADGISGEYARVDMKGRLEKSSGASINVRVLADGMVEIQGEATLVVNAKTGNVRTGNVDGTYELSGNKLLVKGEAEYDCALTITFGKGTLEVTDDNGNCGGLAVSFNGSYKRIGAAKFQ